MKKVFLLLTVVLLSVSCSKSDTPIAEESKSLSRTEWNGTNDTFHIKVTFHEQQVVIVHQARLIDRSYSSSYTYNYAHPKVVMVPYDSGNAIMIGEINGDKMNLINDFSGKTIVVLQKN